MLFANYFLFSVGDSHILLLHGNTDSVPSIVPRRESEKNSAYFQEDDQSSFIWINSSIYKEIID